MDAVSTPARPVDVAADRILQAIERRPAAALGVEYAGLFPTGGTEADEFHKNSPCY